MEKHDASPGEGVAGAVAGSLDSQVSAFFQDRSTQGCLATVETAPLIGQGIFPVGTTALTKRWLGVPGVVECARGVAKGLRN
jgi:hypothetical protein